MVFLHFAGCPVWGDDWASCTCPREWRIERDREPRDEYPWRILRRIESDGDYELFLRCATWSKAIALVTALIRFERNHAG